jgi:hypothetical protein
MADRRWRDDATGVMGPLVTGARLSPDHYRNVAEVYERAIENHHAPLVEIASVWSVKWATAKYWVDKARALGFLAPPVNVSVYSQLRAAPSGDQRDRDVMVGPTRRFQGWIPIAMYAEFVDWANDQNLTVSEALRLLIRRALSEVREAKSA